MKAYSGPVSDHFDGERFFDRDGMPPKSLGEVLRWQLGERKRFAWPDWVDNEHADTPPPRVDGNKVRFAFVGHASWLIQTAGLNILVDPVWSMRVSPVSFAGPKRHNDPGIAFDALPHIDVVLVSHGHYDHFDVPTLSRLAAKFCTSRDHAARQRHGDARRGRRASRPKASTGRIASNSAMALR